MENYDKEFLAYMKTKYKITLEEATSGQESQIINFAIAWNVWKQAKMIYSQNKEINISKFMSADHSRLNYIFQEFKESQKADGYKLLFAEFKIGIERHIRWEEEILFPLAKLKLGNDSAIIDELLLQHKRIIEDVNEISIHLNARNAIIETDLESLLTAHDKMEEDGIYPWLDESIDGETRKDALSKMV